MLELISVEDGGCENGYSLVDVTVSNGEFTIECKGILIFDWDEFDEGMWDEWMHLANAGEDGYTFVEA